MDTETRTDVSVIVPVYNDPEGLETTIESLLAQTYPRADHEVVIVDNDSTDSTYAVATAYSDEHDHVTTVVESDIQSSYAARNTGIDHASGSVLAFVDADMSVPADWLADVVDELATSGAAYMGCDVELYSPGDRESLPEKYNRLSGFPIRQYVEQQHFAPTCCLVVRRSVIEDVGRFDEGLVSGGDREFGNRVHDAGYDLHFASDITMYHPSRSSVRSLATKAIRIGRGSCQLRKRHPERYGTVRTVLLNPVTYLPPIPWLLDDAFDEWHSLSIRERLSLYLLATIATYSRTYGKLSEAFRPATSA